MDPAGVTAICCHSDGCVRIYDLKTGQLMWRAWGHASYVAAATVSPDLTRLVTVGGDGCVVVWTLPDSLTEQLQEAAAAVEAARDQAGCLPASPQLLSMQRAAGLSAGKATASPGGAIGSGASTPLSAGFGAAGASTTPGSCTSDGGISSTLRRLQQGKPLVSADKLPRWARSPNTDSTAGAQLQHALQGGAADGPGQQQQQQRRLSKWLSGRQDGSADGQPCGDASDPRGQVRVGSNVKNQGAREKVLHFG
jgi:hypothetical protein